MVHETLKVSELINQKIEHIKDEFNADRVWVTQFHNGGNFYPTGKSMAKFSIMYETVNPGVSSVQSNFHNIPVNLFSKSINQLLQNDLFSSSNNMLSCIDNTLFVDDMREYSSIFQDIKEETSDELELNYIFYNIAKNRSLRIDLKL